MDEIEIKFTLAERDLIINHTFSDSELTSKLQLTEVKGNQINVKYSIHDLDDLIGFIAAEANHTENKKLEKELDKLFERLSRILETNIDG